jgi:hypothetical protein
MSLAIGGKTKNNGNRLIHMYDTFASSRCESSEQATPSLHTPRKTHPSSLLYLLMILPVSAWTIEQHRKVVLKHQSTPDKVDMHMQYFFHPRDVVWLIVGPEVSQEHLLVFNP